MALGILLACTSIYTRDTGPFTLFAGTTVTDATIAAAIAAAGGSLGNATDPALLAGQASVAKARAKGANEQACNDIMLAAAAASSEAAFPAPTIPPVVTHATSGYVALPSDVLVRVDVSGGIATVKMEPNPTTARERTVKCVAGDCSVNVITVDANGKTVEDPNTPQSYNPTGAIKTGPGAVVTFQYDGAKWQIVA